MKDRYLAGWKISSTQTVAATDGEQCLKSEGCSLMIGKDILGEDFTLEIYPGFLVLDSPWREGVHNRVQIEPGKRLRKKLQQSQPVDPVTRKISDIFHFTPEQAKKLAAELKTFAKEGQPRSPLQKVVDGFLSLLALTIVVAGGLVAAYMVGSMIYVFFKN